MIDFDTEQFKAALKKRRVPKKTLKTITIQDVKINNVPVIEHKEGSFEFTIGFNTSSKIYDLLLENKGKKEINYI